MEDEIAQQLAAKIGEIDAKIATLATQKRELIRSLRAHRKKRHQEVRKSQRTKKSTIGVLLKVLHESSEWGLPLRKIQSALRGQGIEMERKMISTYLTRAQKKGLINRSPNGIWKVNKNTE